MNSFPYYKQQTPFDCGRTCLRMIAKYYAKEYDFPILNEKLTDKGVNLLSLIEAAESIGLSCIPLRVTFQEFKRDIKLPCIIYWKQNHFIVVYKITQEKIYFADPAIGLISFFHIDFRKNWEVSNDPTAVKEGTIITLEPGINF
ncbi:MAG: cysteine peptidase family C39 domain-containing protein [Pseudomonadales bacterium]